VSRLIVVDANILISAVLGSKVIQLIQAHRHEVRFLTPQACVDDAHFYLPPLMTERARSTSVEVIERLLAWVEPLETEMLLPFEKTARALLKRRDPYDWPILAAAWALDAPIWTQDQDFFGLGVATWTTANVEHFLAGIDFKKPAED
jgi:predicted nucleic acid-binding protein